VRFVLAIVAFFIAACMIGYGIAQRTIFLGSPTVALSAPAPKTPEPYTFITNAALTSHPGNQTVEITGNGEIYIAYGRESDVRGWLGDATYTVVDYNNETGMLTSESVQGNPAPTAGHSGEDSGDHTGHTHETTSAQSSDQTVTPQGSDLWLGDYTGESTLAGVIDVPDEKISALIASNGTQPSPSTVNISWPLDNSTPFVGPLLLGGLAFLIVGLALLIWGIIHMRRSRGPRRKSLPPGSQDSLPPAERTYRQWIPQGIRQIGQRHTRGAMLLSVFPTILVTGLVLTGCSSEYWPRSQTPSPNISTTTPGDIRKVEDLIPPAVTVEQAQQIVKNIATTVATADQIRSVEEARLRLSGPALQARETDYKIRAKVPDYIGGTPIPNNAPVVTLPQATAAWSRTVMTVIENPAGSESPPTVLMMTQQTPRENYTVPYALSLFETIPEVAPARIGAPAVAPDSKLLLIQPDHVAAAYGDILLKGSQSQFFNLFQEHGDDFRVAYGVDAQKKKKESIPTTASLEFSNAPGTGPILTLATSDSGALVAVNLMESEIIKPVQPGATVSQNGAASKALSALEASTKGIQTVYGGQLLFYIPPAGSDEKIILLGYNQGLISSSELP
jgi:hypothetical protein